MPEAFSSLGIDSGWSSSGVGAISRQGRPAAADGAGKQASSTAFLCFSSGLHIGHPLMTDYALEAK